MFAALFTALFTFNASAAMTVAIDAGHGGGDRGAVLGAITESSIVLGVSKQLVELLNKDEDFKAFLTRHDDRSVELQNRVHIAKKNKSDLFVSIHANSSPDPQSHGMEIYFRNELEPSEEGLRLASQENQLAESQRKKAKGDLPSILQDLQRSANTLKSYELSWHVVDKWKIPFSRTRQLPIKQGPFHVVNEPNVPAVLVEIGFVTNDKEAKRLSTPSYQKDIAKAIYEGLKDYKETLRNGHSKAIK